MVTFDYRVSLENSKRDKARAERDIKQYSELLRIIKNSDVVSAENKKAHADRVQKLLSDAYRNREAHSENIWLFGTQLEREGVAV